MLNTTFVLLMAIQLHIIANTKKAMHMIDILESSKSFEENTRSFKNYFTYLFNGGIQVEDVESGIQIANMIKNNPEIANKNYNMPTTTEVHDEIKQFKNKIKENKDTRSAFPSIKDLKKLFRKLILASLYEQWTNAVIKNTPPKLNYPDISQEILNIFGVIKSSSSDVYKKFEEKVQKSYVAYQDKVTDYKRFSENPLNSLKNAAIRLVKNYTTVNKNEEAVKEKLLKLVKTIKEMGKTLARIDDGKSAVEDVSAITHIQDIVKALLNARAKKNSLIPEDHEYLQWNKACVDAIMDIITPEEILSLIGQSIKDKVQNPISTDEYKQHIKVKFPSKRLSELSIGEDNTAPFDIGLIDYLSENDPQGLSSEQQQYLVRNWDSVLDRRPFAFSTIRYTQYAMQLANNVPGFKNGLVDEVINASYINRANGAKSGAINVPQYFADNFGNDVAPLKILEPSIGILKLLNYNEMILQRESEQVKLQLTDNQITDLAPLLKEPEGDLLALKGLLERVYESLNENNIAISTSIEVVLKNVNGLEIPVDQLLAISKEELRFNPNDKSHEIVMEHFTHTQANEEKLTVIMSDESFSNDSSLDKIKLEDSFLNIRPKTLELDFNPINVEYEKPKNYISRNFGDLSPIKRKKSNTFEITVDKQRSIVESHVNDLDPEDAHNIVIETLGELTKKQKEILERPGDIKFEILSEVKVDDNNETVEYIYIRYHDVRNPCPRAH